MAITLIVYWRVQNYDFVNFDDGDYVTGNRHVQGGITNANVIWALTTFHAGNWHPLTWLSHMLDYQLFGLKAGMHHLINLLIHMANSILLFFVFKRMTGAMWRSAFVAALFALHPLHVESVAWISERKDVLSTFFWMLTMWAYARYAERPGFNRYLLGLIFFALGLLSKPMIVTLPFVLLLMDFWPLCRVQWGQVCGESSSRFQKAQALRLVWEKIPLFALVLFSCFMTFLSELGGNTVVPLSIHPLSMRVSNALVSYITYIRKTFWPCDLAVFYPYPDAIAWWQAIGAAALLVCMFVLVFKVSRRFPYLVVGWLWYLGALVPVIGLVQVGSQGMADRYIYVPIIGLFMIFVWGVPEICQKWSYRKIWLLASAAFLVLILIMITWKQVGYWENSVTLFENSLRFTSNNYLAHNNLGFAQSMQSRTEEAVEHYLQALRIQPDYAEAHNNLGNALKKQGYTEEAIEHYLQALRIQPDYAEVHYNLGIALDKQGRTEEAIEHYLQALRIKPDYAETHSNLGNALGKQGHTEKAIEHYLQALRINPDFAGGHNNLGNALSMQGYIEKAIEHYLQALRIQPDYAEAHYNLGNALGKQGHTEEAIEHYLQALRIKPDYAGAHSNLGNALDKQDRTEEAIEHYLQALRIKPDYAEAHYNLGIALGKQGHREKAIEHYLQVLRIQPDFAEAHNNLAIALFRKGNIEGAIAHFRKALLINPDDSNAENNLEKILMMQQKK